MAQQKVFIWIKKITITEVSEFSTDSSLTAILLLAQCYLTISNHHQGSTHGWLFRTPHTVNSPYFPCAAEVWEHPGRRAAFIPTCHRDYFLSMIPAQHWCPWLDTLKRRSESTNTPLKTLHYVVHLSVYLPTCLAYNTSSHTSTTQPNNPQDKCMERFLIKRKKILLSSQRIRILPTTSCPKFLHSTLSCPVVSLTNSICQN